MLACILSIFAGFVAPLVIWLTKKDSKFVSFHALQMLYFQLAYLIVFFWIFFRVFAPMARDMDRMRGPAAGPPAFPSQLLGGIWTLSLLSMSVDIFLAIKAKKGQWTRLLVLGTWARRAAGLPAA